MWFSIEAGSRRIFANYKGIHNNIATNPLFSLKFSSSFFTLPSFLHFLDTLLIFKKIFFVSSFSPLYFVIFCHYFLYRIVSLFTFFLYFSVYFFPFRLFFHFLLQYFSLLYLVFVSVKEEKESKHFSFFNFPLSFSSFFLFLLTPIPLSLFFLFAPSFGLNKRRKLKQIRSEN